MTYDPRRYWSEVADRVGGRTGDTDLAGDPSPFYHYKRRAFLQRFLAPLEVRDKTVLEVGCGPGGNLVEVAAANPHRLVGCDVSPNMLSLARAATQGIDVELAQSDGDTLPFPDDAFDIAFTVTVLHHNSDDTVASLLAELRRVTRESFYGFEDTGRARLSAPSFVLRTVDDYRRLASAAGWRLVATRPLDVYASALGHRFVERALRNRGRAEGEAMTDSARSAARVVLKATRPIDRLVRQRQGLTAMQFERI
jgi:SAM-dependent methyltransferase